MAKNEVLTRIAKAAGITPEQAALALKAVAESCGATEESGAAATGHTLRQMLADAGAIPRLAEAIATGRVKWNQHEPFDIHRPTRPLVLVHIPKTAGTAFVNYLHTHFAEKSHVAPPYMGDYSKIGVDDPNILLYWGHFVFREVVEVIPQGVYATFLRNPVDRVISHFKSWANPDNLTADWIRAIPAQEVEAVRQVQAMSLEEFIDSDNPLIRTQIENLATGMLSSHGDPDHPAFLASAKENLSTRFRFVGITEEFDESIRIFRWRFSSRNEYAARPEFENRSRRDITASAMVRTKIERLNQLDCALYEHARDLLRANRDRFMEAAETRVPHLGD